MPIHPLPIIVGTTLLVSGGIAFKKFVYDPHLAPYIEAFLANHTSSFHPQPPHPVPVQHTAQPTYARTSSRRERAPELRRRRRPEDYELRDALSSPNAPSYPGSQAMPPYRKLQDDDVPLSSLKRKEVELRPRFNQDHLLVDLDRPSSPQDAEVREAIFNLPPTPLRSVSPAPSLPPFADVSLKAAHSNLLPDYNRPSLHVPELAAPNSTIPTSTTFSFLSLSQASSPEMSNAMLASMSFSDAAEQWGEMSDFAPAPPSQLAQNVDERQRESSDSDKWATIDVPTVIDNRLTDLEQNRPEWSGTDARESPRDEDAMSLPETSTSGYIDAESYTPGMLSPLRVHTAFSSPRAGLPVSSDLLTERNLRAVEAIPAVSIGPIVLGAEGVMPRGRGQMSVVSLSESEGWGGESDWDARSEAGLHQ